MLLSLLLKLCLFAQASDALGKLPEIPSSEILGVLIILLASEPQWGHVVTFVYSMNRVNTSEHPVH